MRFYGFREGSSRLIVLDARVRVVCEKAML
jgi:hypothetical protein